MKNSFFFFIFLLFVSTTQGQNNPEAVSIGTQIWMKTNLDVSTYRNGDPIPEVEDSAAWAELTTGAWCYYRKKSENGKIYGKLYNWYAVNDSRGLAPEGWHIPGKDEWTKLSDFLGGDTVAGGKMKETGTTYWREPNAEATNTSGFTGLPGGYRGGRDGGSMFILKSETGAWWSSTEDSAEEAWLQFLSCKTGILKRNNKNKQFGFSVRCVKD